MAITIYLLFIGISRENIKFPENFLFCLDFSINSEYVILFHFESHQKSSKKKGKNPQIFVNKRENRKFLRDDKGCNWIQNGLKYLNILITNLVEEELTSEGNTSPPSPSFFFFLFLKGQYANFSKCYHTLY